MPSRPPGSPSTPLQGFLLLFFFSWWPWLISTHPLHYFLWEPFSILSVFLAQHHTITYSLPGAMLQAPLPCLCVPVPDPMRIRQICCIIVHGRWKESRWEERRKGKGNGGGKEEEPLRSHALAVCPLNTVSSFSFVPTFFTETPKLAKRKINPALVDSLSFPRIYVLVDCVRMCAWIVFLHLTPWSQGLPSLNKKRKKRNQDSITCISNKW